MSVYFVKGKGKGWRYDFTLKGTRHTETWFKTKAKAKEAESQVENQVKSQPTKQAKLLLPSTRAGTQKTIRRQSFTALPFFCFIPFEPLIIPKNNGKNDQALLFITRLFWLRLVIIPLPSFVLEFHHFDRDCVCVCIKIRQRLELRDPGIVNPVRHRDLTGLVKVLDQDVLAHVPQRAFRALSSAQRTTQRVLAGCCPSR